MRPFSEWYLDYNVSTFIILSMVLMGKAPCFPVFGAPGSFESGVP